MEAVHDGELVRQHHQGPNWRISKRTGVLYRLQRSSRPPKQEEPPATILCCYWSTYVTSCGHCEIYWRDQAYWIKDVGSTNGTYLNGNQLKKDVERELRFGDVIGVGVNPLGEEDYQQPVTHKVYCVYKFLEAAPIVEVVDLADEDDEISEVIDEAVPPPSKPRPVPVDVETCSSNSLPSSVTPKPPGRPKCPPPPIISNRRSSTFKARNGTVEVNMPSTSRNAQQSTNGRQSESSRSEERMKPAKRSHPSSSDDSSDGLEVIGLVSSQSSSGSKFKTAPGTYSAVSSEDSRSSCSEGNDDDDIIDVEINQGNHHPNDDTPHRTNIPTAASSNRYNDLKNSSAHAQSQKKDLAAAATTTPRIIKSKPTARKRTCPLPLPRNKIRKTHPSESAPPQEDETEDVDIDRRPASPSPPPPIPEDKRRESEADSDQQSAADDQENEEYDDADPPESNSDEDEVMACSDEENEVEQNTPQQDTQSAASKPTPPTSVTTLLKGKQQQQPKRIQCLNYAPPPRFAARAQKRTAALIAPLPSTSSSSRSFQNGNTHSRYDTDRDLQNMTMEEKKQLRIEKLKEIELKRQQEREANKKKDTPKPKVPAKVKFTSRNRGEDLAESIIQYHHDKQ